MNTSQREQYGGTVHLFIGTGHSLCKITFMPFIFTIDLWTTQRGLDSLFPFKLVPIFAIEPKLPCAQLRNSISLCLDHAFYIVYGFIPSLKVPVHILHLGSIVKSCFWGSSELLQGWASVPFEQVCGWSVENLPDLSPSDYSRSYNKDGDFCLAVRSQGLEPSAKCFCSMHELLYETKAMGKEQYNNNFGCYGFISRPNASHPVPTFRKRWPRA
jgi:hypothetical protein